jgi:hypothetical protein
VKTKTNHLLVKQPLQVAALLAAVRLQTGLDDFGDVREPQSRLLDYLRKRGTPDTMGRCVLTQEILQLLIGYIFSAIAKSGGGSDYRAAVYKWDCAQGQDRL